jgi:E3 ubiquitin-protein ligase BRE1
LKYGSAEKEESIIEVKKLITTLHKEMSALQGQLYEYKEAGSAVYACRAELHSLRRILERKVHCFTKFPSGNDYVK